MLELGNDEVYYIGYAKQLQLHYFDHPPFVAFILKTFSLNLQLESEFFMRWGFILTGAVASYVVYCIATRLHHAYTGLVAVWLFTAAPYAAIISGMMIMPDGPLLLFWLLSALQAVKIVQGVRVIRSLLLFGCFAGLAFLSKVSAAILWPGLGLYILVYDRSLLKNKYLYVALAITLLLASPVIWWDPANTAAGSAYHAGRVVAGFFKINVTTFLRQVLGEVGYNNPVVYVLSWIGAFYTFRVRSIDKRATRLILLLSIPLILAVDILSLFRETLPHWTGPSFALLSVFGAIYLSDRRMLQKKRTALLPAYLANMLLIVAIALIVIGTRYAPPFRSADNDPLKTGRGDLFLDISGWKQFGRHFGYLYHADLKTGRVQPGAYVFAHKWFPGAHLDWYVARACNAPFMAIGQVNDLHQYMVLNKSIAPVPVGGDAYYITCSNYFVPPEPALLQFFEKADAAALILSQKRNGKIVRNFYVTRLYNYRGGLPGNGIIK